MAKNQDVFFTDTPQIVSTGFTDADTATDVDGGSGTIVLLATAGADDTVVRSLSITSSDTSAKDVMLFISNSATLTTGNGLIGIINVPITAGFDTSVAAVNGLNSTALPHTRIDKDGNRILVLKSGWYLKAGLKAALTSAKKVKLVCISEDY